MKLQKLSKKIKLAAFVLAFTLAPTEVFASEAYPITDYPPRINNVPGFYITMIDPTNNQIEFTLNELFGVEPARFGVAWIEDRANAEADVRSFTGVDESFARKVFWSDDYDLELESYHSRDVAGFLRKYVIDSEVDLRENIYHDFYYIIETTDGERWANKVTYDECGEAWTEGMACFNAGIKNDTEVDNVTYGLGEAPEKFIKTEIYRSHPEPEPVVEPEPDEPVEPDDSEPSDSDETGVVEGENAENAEKSDSVQNSDDAQAPVVIERAVAQVARNATDTDEEIVEETDEVNEGFGDTTLEVPMLGGAEKTDEKIECEKINVLPYVLSGVGIGAISTWFLFLMIKKAKTLQAFKS